MSAKTRLKQVKRNARKQQLGAKQLTYPSKLYGVIVCDDEWDYEVWPRETSMDRHAATHLPTAPRNCTRRSLHQGLRRIGR
jgi:hypothetical protein